MTFFEPQTVAAIFDVHAQDEIMELAAIMPVWVIDSPENLRAIAEARKLYQFQMTIFFVLPGEPMIEMCSRILFNMDEHHYCDKFDLHGVFVDSVDPLILTELKIQEVRQTEYGCQLIRAARTSLESGVN